MNGRRSISVLQADLSCRCRSRYVAAMAFGSNRVQFEIDGSEVLICKRTKKSLAGNSSTVAMRSRSRPADERIRFLLVSSGSPSPGGGPIVVNTRAELRQAPGASG